MKRLQLSLCLPGGDCNGAPERHFFSVWVDLQWLLCLCCSRQSFFRCWHIFKSGVEIVSDILHVWFWVKMRVKLPGGVRLSARARWQIRRLFPLQPSCVFLSGPHLLSYLLFAVISHPAERFYCGISLATVQCDVERASRPDVGGLLR